MCYTLEVVPHIRGPMRTHCSQSSSQLCPAHKGSTWAHVSTPCYVLPSVDLLSAPFLELKPLAEVAGDCGKETGRRRELYLLPASGWCRPGRLGQKQKRLEEGSLFLSSLWWEEWLCFNERKNGHSLFFSSSSSQVSRIRFLTKMPIYRLRWKFTPSSPKTCW